jgi:adenylate kinase family enzyme
MEMRYQAADLIIFLDINRFLCMLSAFKRHGTKRSDLPEYLEEKLDFEFLQFCKWIWDFSKKGKPTIMELHKKYPEKPFLVIKSRRKLQKMLVGWRNDRVQDNVII